MGQVNPAPFFLWRGIVTVLPVAAMVAASGAQRAFVGSGTATTDGLLTRSADGACLAVPGYGRDLGTGSGNLVSGSVAGGGAIPRVVARVSATGAIDTSTALTDAAVAGNFRSAASLPVPRDLGR